MSFYKENAKFYAESTINPVFAESIFEKVAIFKNTSKKRVLDIGCGSGRDALYLTNKGFDIDAFDKEPEMLKQARSLTGLDIFNQGSAEDFKSDKTYDLGYSIACLLHLNDEEFHSAITNILSHLNTGAKFFFTLKKGDGEEVDSMGRYFNYYTEEKLKSSLKDFNVNIEEIYEVNDLTRPDVVWLNVIIEKTA